MSTDKTFKIEPLNDELIEAIDVEIWSPEQPKWFIDWFSNKSDADSILNLDEIDCNSNLENFFLNDKRYSLLALDFLIANNPI